MLKFIKLAQKHNAIAEFWALRENKDTFIGRNFEKYSIINPLHKKHKDLINILKKKEFTQENIILYPELKKLIKYDNI